MRSRILAPGCLSGPVLTSLVRNPLLFSLTTTGFVIFLAIFKGTPSCLIDKLGSGVITERALKSTLLPIRFPLTLPVLPFNLSFIDLSGLPERCATEATPGIRLSI